MLRHLLYFLGLFLLDSLFFPFTESIPKQVEVRPHDDGVLDKLLHAVYQPVPVATGHEPTAFLLLGELSVRLRDGALIWNGEHAHPATENAQRVDGIEGL